MAHFRYRVFLLRVNPRTLFHTAKQWVNFSIQTFIFRRSSTMRRVDSGLDTSWNFIAYNKALYAVSWDLFLQLQAQNSLLNYTNTFTNTNKKD